MITMGAPDPGIPADRRHPAGPDRLRELPADEPIPPQAELVERLKEARGTCAKAVRTLRDAEIVYVVTGKGAYPYAKEKRPKR